MARMTTESQLVHDGPDLIVDCVAGTLHLTAEKNTAAYKPLTQWRDEVAAALRDGNIVRVKELEATVEDDDGGRYSHVMVANTSSKADRVVIKCVAVQEN